MGIVKVVEISHPDSAQAALKFESDGTVLLWSNDLEEYVSLN